jgi:hypothetical protein
MTAVRLAFWTAIWIGGLAVAGWRYDMCTDEGGIIRGCGHKIEYLAWVTSFAGLVMLVRSLRATSLGKRWFSD